MFFLYHKTSYKTGKALAKALGFQNFGKVGRPVDLLLRWGNAAACGARQEINPATAILKASDKLTAFNVWSRLEDDSVQYPAFTTDRVVAQGWFDRGEVVFGRTRHGFKGHGIKIYESTDWELAQGVRLGQHELYTVGIKTKREYRLHVVGEEVIRVQRKYPTIAGTDFAWIKNHAAGFVFKQPRNALKTDRGRMAVRAVKELGLDFGAVDLVIDETGQPYILEVNTAPSCSPITATAYVNALASLIALRSAGDYIPNVAFHHLEGLRPEGEVVDEARAAVFAYA